MDPSTEAFDQFRAQLDAHGVDAALSLLAEQLRADERYHELFETLKIQARHRLGLTLWPDEATERLDGPLRDQLEEALLDACRQVGTLLVRKGKIRDGWMYLRVLGDGQLVANLLAEIAVTEENLDELVDVALGEGVDPCLAFRLILEHWGTCNAITAYDSEVRRHGLDVQRQAAAMLVQHVHRELCENVRADIQQREGAPPPNGSLEELIEPRPWLFADQSYHLDPSHLAAAVRFARILRDRDPLQLAYELADYGRRLAPELQFADQEPFAELFASCTMFFGAVLGRQVDQALAYFREKAEQLREGREALAAVEAYVDLLERLGRYRDALEVAVQWLPPKARGYQTTRWLLELGRQAGDYEPVIQFCRQREDLLGYAASLLQAKVDQR